MNIKHITKLFAVLGLLLLCAITGHAQLLTQTTLSGAVTGGGPYSGQSQLLQTSITIASITGLQPALLGTQVQSIIYIDREAMGVITVPTAATGQVQVIRGMLGTAAAPHVSGTMVLFGQVNLMGQNAFFQRDPDAGACSTTFPQTPWINVLTGAQWTCSAVTGTWAPSWNNPLSAPASWVQTATVASAAGAITPSGPYFNISGTAAITGFNIPVGFNGTAFGNGCFTANPTAIWTWTAAGNIATAGTTTAANTPVTFCWNAVTSKWIPSRLA